jgi:hypothetical protein
MRKAAVFLFTTLALAMTLSASIDDSITPVPEPGTILLMGLGIAAIGFAKWRKGRKK